MGSRIKVCRIRGDMLKDRLYVHCPPMCSRSADTCGTYSLHNIYDGLRTVQIFDASIFQAAEEAEEAEDGEREEEGEATTTAAAEPEQPPAEASGEVATAGADEHAIIAAAVDEDLFGDDLGLEGLDLED